MRIGKPPNPLAPQKKLSKKGRMIPIVLTFTEEIMWRINKSSCRAFPSYAQLSGRIETEGKPRTIQILLTSHLSRHSSSEEVWDQHNKIEKQILKCSHFLGRSKINKQQVRPLPLPAEAKKKKTRLIAGTFQGCTSSFPP